MSDASVFVWDLKTVPDARMLGVEHASDGDRPSSKAGVKLIAIDCTLVAIETDGAKLGALFRLLAGRHSGFSIDGHEPGLTRWNRYQSL
jgi:hypothetical protein